MRAPTQVRFTLEFDAVIFDCDGVLVDSEPVHDSATIDELRSRGVELPRDFLDPHRGRRVVDQIAAISEHYGLDPAELLEAREARFWRAVRDDLAAVPGSADCVRTLHENGIAVAVATSGSRRWIDYVLDTLNLSNCVSHVVSGDEVLNPKPHPEPYQRAAHLLGVPGPRCVVVEDSVLGYQSARAAGCSVVAFTSGDVGEAAERFPEAHALAEHMEDVRQVLLETTSSRSSNSTESLI